MTAPEEEPNKRSRKLLRLEPKNAVPPDWRFPETATSADPLALALSHAFHLNGSDTPAETFARSVALPADGRLTPALAVEAVRRQDGVARLTKLRLGDLSDAVLPALLFVSGNRVCVVQERDTDGTLVLWWPEGDGPARVDDIYLGRALLLRPSEPRSRAEGEASREHWFWGTIARFWPDYLQVILASALVNIFALAVPVFTLNVYDRVFPNAALITLWSLVAGVALALLFDAALKLLRGGVVDAVGRRVDLRASSRLFRHILALDLEAGPARGGSLVNTLKDFEQVREVFSSQTVATLTDLVFAALFLAVIAYLGGPLVWPPIIAMGTVVVLVLLLIVPLRRRAAESRNRSASKTAVAVETVGALETLRATNGAARMLRRWEDAVTGAAVSNERSRRLANTAATLTATASQMSSIGIVVMGVYLALEGQLTMGTVIAAMILSGRALAPMAVLAGLMVRMSFAVDALGALNGMMSLPARAASGGLNAPVRSGAVTLDDVTLAYGPDAPRVLGPVSVTVEPGERVALIGTVGAGKTSLLRIMAGLWHPTSGALLLDGVNADQIAPDLLRQAVQLVPQEPVLFSGSLSENIAFGQPWARDAEIAEAARAAGVDTIAANHPDGFGMAIAERGANLSGGQRQMVAIARALLSRPQILLLDEPTAAMDQETERQFIARLTGLVKTRRMTLVVATHRSSLLELVDRVVLLDRGAVRRDGPRDVVIRELSGERLS